LEKLVDATPTGAHDFVSDFYNNIKTIMRDVSKPTVTELSIFATEKRSASLSSLKPSSEVDISTKVVNNIS